MRALQFDEFLYSLPYIFLSHSLLLVYSFAVLCICIACTINRPASEEEVQVDNVRISSVTVWSLFSRLIECLFNSRLQISCIVLLGGKCNCIDIRHPTLTSIFSCRKHLILYLFLRCDNPDFLMLFIIGICIITGIIMLL